MINSDQYRSALIGIDLYWVKLIFDWNGIREIILQIDLYWLAMIFIEPYFGSMMLINSDQYRSALICIDLYWVKWIGIDRYWLAFGIDSACPEKLKSTIVENSNQFYFCLSIKIYWRIYHVRDIWPSKSGHFFCLLARW